MSLYETIYALRTARGMSQLELAEALDVSRQSISKWETGAAVPELDKLVKLSDVFGITLDELVRGTAETSGEAVVESAAAELAAPQPRRMELHRIIALALLCTGLLLTVLLLVFAGIEPALTLGLPLVVIGFVFLAIPPRGLLWAIWGVWIAAVLVARKLFGGWFLSFAVGNKAGAVVALPMLAGLIALIIATVRRFRKK